MIIVNKTKKKISSLVFIIPILLFSAIALWATSDRQGKTDKEANTEFRIFCDAEYKDENDNFSCGDILLKHGETQSSEQAYSGKFSSKVTRDNQYSFSINYKNFQPNDKINVSAWVKGIEHKDVFLAVQGIEGYKFYKQSNDDITNENGWRKKYLEFNIPKDYPSDSIKVFAYTSNKNNPAYIDDFEIINLNRQFINDDTQDSLGKTHKLYFDLKALRKLKQQRDQALELGILKRSEDDWVKAKLISQGQKHEVKARLKGDWTDHLYGDFWSYRIKMPKDASWNRLMTFSLQNPNSRFSLAEWVFHKFLEYEDVLTPRYDFVRLAINDDLPKTYAYEEHFVKQLVEFKNRREGVIIKFSEADYWDHINYQLEHNVDINETVPNQDLLADIEPFKESKIIGDPKFEEQYREAASLLAAFQSSKASISEVFDVDRLAKYYVICDILKAYHSTIWHNRRFYYNPIIRKLEPIGFDGYAAGGIFDWHHKAFLGAYLSSFVPSGNREQETLLYRDKEFNKAYTRYLYEFSDLEYLDNFINSITGDLIEREKMIQANDADYKHDLKPIFKQAKRIRAALGITINDLKAFKSKSTNEEYKIELTNDHPLPLEVIGFSDNGKNVTVLDDPVLVYSNARWHAPAYTSTTIGMPYKFAHFKLAGKEEILVTRIKEWPAAKPNVASTSSLSMPLDKSAWTEDGNKIIISRGEHLIKKPLIIPDNKELIIHEGTILDFQKKAYLLSYSPIFLKGTQAEPISIISSDNSSQGIHILNAEQKSILEYTSFSGHNTLSDKAWQMTGAVTFYESPVDLRNVTIGNNHCEDALNTIRSHFLADGLHINNTYADGFDADFCKGSIMNSKFVNTGNDGIDFSGSVIEVDGVEFSNIGDKGISVGEEAQVVVKSATIDKANIGVASKDLSRLIILNIELKNCKTGFAAYQKKPEFGRGYIEIEKYSVENVEKLKSKDKASRIKFLNKDDEEI